MPKALEIASNGSSSTIAFLRRRAYRWLVENRYECQISELR